MTYLITILVMIFGGMLLFFIIPSAIENGKQKKYFEIENKNLDMEDVEKQKEESKKLFINEIQKEVIFTKDYIIPLKGNAEGEVFLVKNLVYACHYVVIKQNIKLVLGGTHITKFTRLEFKGKVYHLLDDIVNSKEAKKANGDYEFDNTLLQEIAKMYGIEVGTNRNVQVDNIMHV